MKQYIIKPNKYTRVDVSVVGLSFEIIKLLQQENFLKLNHLLAKLVLSKGEVVRENFVLSLNFLYVLGKLEYYDKNDVLQLVENYETV